MIEPTVDPFGVVFHDEVQLLDWGESRASGPYIKLRLRDAAQLEVFRGMDTATKVQPGHILHVTICENDVAEAAASQPDAVEPKPYGQQARALKLSGFFRAPNVWEHVGTDDVFLAWLRQQPCAHCNAHAPSEAAHVRRVANGAGTGLKPKYSAIPLCHEHHHAQHAQGEDAIGGRDKVDQLRIRYLQDWCWVSLKATLGHEHWNEVPPAALHTWASERGVANYLPGEYVP